MEFRSIAPQNIYPTANTNRASEANDQKTVAEVPADRNKALFPKDIIEIGSSAQKKYKEYSESDGVAEFARQTAQAKEDWTQYYERLSKIEPVEAVELDDAQIKEIKETATRLGLPTTNGNDDLFLRMDDMEYHFKPDGSVSMYKAGVPTSEQNKQAMLSAIEKLINSL